MNITITSRKFKAHSTLKEHIEEEVKSLNRFNDDIINADVILSYQNNHDSIKIVKSVNSAIEKLTRQLEKLKTKRTSRVK